MPGMTARPQQLLPLAQCLVDVVACQIEAAIDHPRTAATPVQLAAIINALRQAADCVAAAAQQLPGERR